jgi:hypothetical protein
VTAKHKPKNKTAGTTKTAKSSFNCQKRHKIININAFYAQKQPTSTKREINLKHRTLSGKGLFSAT